MRTISHSWFYNTVLLFLVNTFYLNFAVGLHCTYMLHLTFVFRPQDAKIEGKTVSKVFIVNNELVKKGKKAGGGSWGVACVANGDGELTEAEHEEKLKHWRLQTGKAARHTGKLCTGKTQVSSLSKKHWKNTGEWRGVLKKHKREGHYSYWLQRDILWQKHVLQAAWSSPADHNKFVIILTLLLPEKKHPSYQGNYKSHRFYIHEVNWKISSMCLEKRRHDQYGEMPTEWTFWLPANINTEG